MAGIRIVLVEPLYPANIGYIARVMKNFGFNELYLIDPQSRIDKKESYKFAVHADDVLDEARVLPALSEAVKNVDLIIGTTSKPSKSPRNVLRHSLTVKELIQNLRGYEGSVAIIVGREDNGLSNAELEACDLIVNIPTSPIYPALNVSHAVSIITYELYNCPPPHSKKNLPNRIVFDRVLRSFEELVAALMFPKYRQNLVNRAFRNVISRSIISKREATLILGVLQRTLHRLV